MVAKKGSVSAVCFIKSNQTSNRNLNSISLSLVCAEKDNGEHQQQTPAGSQVRQVRARLQANAEGIASGQGQAGDPGQ